MSFKGGLNEHKNWLAKVSQVLPIVKENILSKKIDYPVGDIILLEKKLSSKSHKVFFVSYAIFLAGSTLKFYASIFLLNTWGVLDFLMLVGCILIPVFHLRGYSQACKKADNIIRKFEMGTLGVFHVKPTERTTLVAADELEKLHQLKLAGALSENEYEEQKKKVLKAS